MTDPDFATGAGGHPRAQAEARDAERRAGRLRGPPYGIDVAGMSVSCGTDGHDSAPAARDAGIANLAASVESVLGRGANGRRPAGRCTTCAHCPVT